MPAMRATSTPAAQRQRGFQYVEVLVATVVLAVCLAPALEALTGTGTTRAGAATLDRDLERVHARLETVLAQPFASLEAAAAGNATPGSYSDAAGTPGRLLVYIAGYDGDNADGDGNPFTGADSGLLWVRVRTEEGRPVLTTLTAR